MIEIKDQSRNVVQCVKLTLSERAALRKAAAAAGVSVSAYIRAAIFELITRNTEQGRPQDETQKKSGSAATLPDQAKRNAMSFSYRYNCILLELYRLVNNEPVIQQNGRRSVSGGPVLCIWVQSQYTTQHNTTQPPTLTPRPQAARPHVASKPASSPATFPGNDARGGVPGHNASAPGLMGLFILLISGRLCGALRA